MTFAEVHVKRSLILTDRLGPDILLMLRMKRQVLHRERAHLKVTGCSLVLSDKNVDNFLVRSALKTNEQPSTTVSLETTPFIHFLYIVGYAPAD